MSQTVTLRRGTVATLCVGSSASTSALMLTVLAPDLWFFLVPGIGCGALGLVRYLCDLDAAADGAATAP